MAFKINPTTSKLDYYEPNTNSPSGGLTPMILDSYKVLGATSPTLLTTVDLDVGFTYAFEITGLSQRGAGSTGSFIKVVRQFGRTAGGSIAAAPSVSFNSVSYSVVPSFVLVGNTVEVYAGVAGGIPINWNLELKVYKIENT
jgi:hypothetical protein